MTTCQHICICNENDVNFKSKWHFWPLRPRISPIINFCYYQELFDRWMTTCQHISISNQKDVNIKNAWYFWLLWPQISPNINFLDHWAMFDRWMTTWQHICIIWQCMVIGKPKKMFFFLIQRTFTSKRRKTIVRYHCMRVSS